jgi:transposase
VRVQYSAGDSRLSTRPKLVVADRGYDAGGFRRYLRRRGIRCVILEKGSGKRRRQRRHPPTYRRATYRQHNVIERVIGWLKEHRRITTRFEKLASSFIAMVKSSFVRRYFRSSERFSDNTLSVKVGQCHRRGRGRSDPGALCCAHWPQIVSVTGRTPNQLTAERQSHSVRIEGCKDYTL